MANRISRRKLATHVASELLSGKTTALDELAAYLIDTKRTREAELIIRDIEAALLEKGVLLADVVTAHELSADTKSTLVDYLQKKTEAKEVKLRESRDESLIGGVKVTIPGAVFDTSVRHKLNVLRTTKL